MNTARKGDIVAIQQNDTTFYIRRASETRQRWRLARVVSATRTGIAKSVQLPGPGAAEQIKYMGGAARVHCISSLEGAQAAAERIFAERDWDSLDWSSADELRAAIRAEIANPRS